MNLSSDGILAWVGCVLYNTVQYVCIWGGWVVYEDKALILKMGLPDWERRGGSNQNLLTRDRPRIYYIWKDCCTSLKTNSIEDWLPTGCYIWTLLLHEIMKMLSYPISVSADLIWCASRWTTYRYILTSVETKMFVFVYLGKNLFSLRCEYEHVARKLLRKG
jgi:hypothetical protein